MALNFKLRLPPTSLASDLHVKCSVVKLEVIRIICNVVKLSKRSLLTNIMTFGLLLILWNVYLRSRQKKYTWLGLGKDLTLCWNNYSQSCYISLHKWRHVRMLIYVIYLKNKLLLAHIVTTVWPTKPQHPSPDLTWPSLYNTAQERSTYTVTTQWLAVFGMLVVRRGCSVHSSTLLTFLHW